MGGVLLVILIIAGFIAFKIAYHRSESFAEKADLVEAITRFLILPGLIGGTIGALIGGLAADVAGGILGALTGAVIGIAFNWWNANMTAKYG